MKYFDAHMHVQFPAYDEDREEVLREMKKEDVGGIVVGCDLVSSEKALIVAKSDERLYASVGQHPNHEKDEEFNIEKYRELLKDERVVAIGECGLDYFRPEEVTDELKERQKELFQKHIDLAIEHDRPLIIHARPSKGSQNAYEDALLMLEVAKETHPSLRGDFHFFVGNVETAKRILGIDFTMSFTAVLTFTHDYDDVVQYLPITHILTETDSPYVSPASRRGQRNTPLSAIDVVEAISNIRNESMEMVRSQVLQNAEKLFSINVS